MSTTKHMSTILLGTILLLSSSRAKDDVTDWLVSSTTDHAPIVLAAGSQLPEFFVDLCCNPVFKPNPTTKKDINCYTANGIFVSNQWVLVAASIFKVNCHPYLSKKRGCYVSARMVPCRKVVYHEFFDDAAMKYDVALVKTKRPIFKVGFKIATPWAKRKGLVGTENCGGFTIYSEGRNKDNDGKLVEKVTSGHLDECHCHQDHAGDETIFCFKWQWQVSVTDTPNNFCPEDSGGAVVCDGSVVGMVSHLSNRYNNNNISCRNYTDDNIVATKIDYYYSFIENVTGVKMPFESEPPPPPPPPPPTTTTTTTKKPDYWVEYIEPEEWAPTSGSRRFRVWPIVGLSVLLSLYI